MMSFNHKQASENLLAIKDKIQQNLNLDEWESFLSNNFKQLTQDNELMFELAMFNEISVCPFHSAGTVETLFKVDGVGSKFTIVNISDHNNDFVETARVAIYEALIKKTSYL